MTTPITLTTVFAALLGGGCTLNLGIPEQRLARLEEAIDSKADAAKVDSALRALSNAHNVNTDEDAKVRVRIDALEAAQAAK